MSKRKRKVRKQPPKPIKRKVKLFPVIFCLKENKAIALGLRPLKYKMRGDRVKLRESVHVTQWQKDNSMFLEGYEIDFHQCNLAEKVLCPKCGGAVDFRVFPSSITPKLTDVSDEEDKDNLTP